MSQLINDVFGDAYISIRCDGGECLHYSQVPEYVVSFSPYPQESPFTFPQTPEGLDNTKYVAPSIAGAGIAGAGLIVIVVSAALWYAGRARKIDFGEIRLPDSEVSRLMTDHAPASLYFTSVIYKLGPRTVSDSIYGCAKPGQVMATIGNLRCCQIYVPEHLDGELVNGREVSLEEYRKVVGFVDREGTLMNTLTVYETVLYSALLRLPGEMSLEAKKYKTLETINELGILGIKDMRIGDLVAFFEASLDLFNVQILYIGKRCIPGGEKRHASIVCELVTSPSILFLDEPTSGTVHHYLLLLYGTDFIH